MRCFSQNYGNFTNNKVDTHNEKIKEYMSRNMHLPEALRNLLNYNRPAYSIFFIYENKN